MNYLQASRVESTNKFKSRLLSLILLLNLVAVIATFTFNFLALPILKYHYLIHIGISIIAVLFFDFAQILPIILTLFFLEGQGKILWGYDNWARIIFDSLVFFALIKIFIIKKKVVDFDQTPIPLIVLIALYFSWYMVEFTNLYSVSFFATIAATKIYIYPILLFFGLTQTDFDVYNKNFQNCLNFFMFLLFLELALSFYQFSGKESQLLLISPYYAKIMKGIFYGKKFRPFGTTNLPGAVSAFSFVTIGFLYLKKKSMIESTVRILLIIASGYILILCQVRSAFIKFVLIIIAIHLGELIFFRFRARAFVGLFFLTFVIFLGAQFLSNDSTTGDESLDHARDRMFSLSNVNKMRSSRLEADGFVKMAAEKLIEFPLGFGPGLTGAAGSLNTDAFAGNRVVNMDSLWSGDNLFISLIIDFGIGAIFYILILLYIPIYFTRFLIILYRNKSYEPYQILLVCFSSVLVIIAGNWGAVGITYNPESFAFWFFSALGFSTIAKYKKNLSRLCLMKNDKIEEI